MIFRTVYPGLGQFSFLRSLAPITSEPQLPAPTVAPMTLTPTPTSTPLPRSTSPVPKPYPTLQPTHPVLTPEPYPTPAPSPTIFAPGMMPTEVTQPRVSSIPLPEYTVDEVFEPPRLPAPEPEPGPGPSPDELVQLAASTICEARNDGRTEREAIEMVRKRFPTINDTLIVMAQQRANLECPMWSPPPPSLPPAAPQLPERELFEPTPTPASEFEPPVSTEPVFNPVFEIEPEPVPEFEPPVVVDPIFVPPDEVFDSRPQEDAPPDCYYCPPASVPGGGGAPPLSPPQVDVVSVPLPGGEVREVEVVTVPGPDGRPKTVVLPPTPPGQLRPQPATPLPVPDRPQTVVPASAAQRGHPWLLYALIGAGALGTGYLLARRK